MSVSLEDKLEKLLRKHGVDNKVDVYLKSKNVITVAKFAELADNRVM